MLVGVQQTALHCIRNHQAIYAGEAPLRWTTATVCQHPKSENACINCWPHSEQANSCLKQSAVYAMACASPHITAAACCVASYCCFALQKDMLEDHKRTGAYYNAVMQNRRQFKDKVVLDVGTGSGILAIFSAMAGAKKVYAVEATDMAKHARTLVAHNKVRTIGD
jgi:hypothetical protein